MYVLREAFDYSHREIAEILDLTEAASQQILHRAKKHVAAGRARTEIDRAAARRIVEEFLAAAASGRTEPLVALLTQDAVAIGDGGGKVPARTRPFEGALSGGEVHAGPVQARSGQAGPGRRRGAGARRRRQRRAGPRRGRGRPGHQE
ncbi:DNA-directed RNA polymerase sigma-70 factor OS=Streptomyces fumanus OX=67302 GN=GCM10018772_11400 PE=3 SV=1 [Streptomyces fumanus]